MASSFVSEEIVADISVRILETEREDAPYFYAAGAPIADEWCYVADGPGLGEVQTAARAILSDEMTRSIFVRCAALMGVEWDGDVIALLDAQMVNGMALMTHAPDVGKAEPEQLRKIRRAVAAGE